MKWKIFLIIMLVWRLFLAFHAKHGDMYNNLDWGKIAVDRGLNGFYDLPKEIWPHSRPNQPPGSILLHAASRYFYLGADKLINWSNAKLPIFPSFMGWWWQDHGELVSIKIPSITADFAIFAAIYTWGSPLVAAIYLLNPVLWYNSSFWGQTDAVVAAFAVWSLLCLFKKKYTLSVILLALSFVIKASWLPIVPLYLLYWFRNKVNFAPLLAGLITAFVVVLPFQPQITLIARILAGESAYVTVNAFNFWNLVYGPDFVLEQSWMRSISILIVALFLGWQMFRLWKKPEPQMLLQSSMLLFFAVFLFMTRMHERYLYPVFPLISLLLVSESRYWFGYIVLSITFLINLYFQWWAPGIPWLVAIYTPTFTKIISGINLAIFAYENKN